MFARVATTGLGGIVVAAVMSAASVVPASAATLQVRMHEFMFCVDAGCTQSATAGNGGVLTINPGDTVQWVWDEHGTLINPPPDPLPNCDTDAFVIAQMTTGNGCPGHTVTSNPAQPYNNACDYRAVGCPFKFQFNVSGTFHYYCFYHGGKTQGNPLSPTNAATNMDGTVVVRGAGTGPNTPTTTNAATGQRLGGAPAANTNPGFAMPLTGTDPTGELVRSAVTYLAPAATLALGIALLLVLGIRQVTRRPG